MKNKLNLYYRISLLFLNILLFLWSCEKDNLPHQLVEYQKKQLNVSLVSWSHFESLHTAISAKVGMFRNENNLNKRIRSSQNGFYINDTNVQIIENEHFTTYTFHVIREEPLVNILENYTYKEYLDGTFEQYLVKYHYTLGTSGEKQYDTSILEIEAISDDGLILNKSTSCVPEFVEVLDSFTCTENTRCTGNGQHEVGDGNCTCTDSPTTCDPAGSTSCNYDYVWVYQSCAGSGTTDNTTNDTNNTNQTNGGGNSTNNPEAGNETPSIPLEDSTPIWQPILNCINSISLNGQTDMTTIDPQIMEQLTFSVREWLQINDYLDANNCSESAQEETIENLLDRYDEEQIINDLEGKALCVYNRLKSSSGGFKNAIKKFDGDFPVAHLKFNADDLDDNTRGETSPPENFVITITLNNDSSNNGYSYRPNLLTAKTIIHEVIHAEMFRKLLELSSSNGNINVATLNQMLTQSDYPGMLDYYTRYGINGFQHQQMATHYKETIARLLQDFDANVPLPSNQQPSQLYLDLAWEGLNHSNIVEWQVLTTQEEKNRIDGVIANYINLHANEQCN